MNDNRKEGWGTKVKRGLVSFFTTPVEEDTPDPSTGDSRGVGPVTEGLYSDYRSPNVEELVPTASPLYYDDEEIGMNEINMNDGRTKVYSNNEIIIVKPNFVLEPDFTGEELEDAISELIVNLKCNKIVHLDLRELEAKDAGVVEFACIGACAALDYSITEIIKGDMFLLTPSGVKVSQEERVIINKKRDRDDDNSEDSSGYYRYSNDYK